MKSMKLLPLILSALVFPAGQFRTKASPASSTMQITVDFGEDRGQNFGSLFQFRDKTGRVIAGAGFSGAYNTQPRADRFMLSFFIKPPVDEKIVYSRKRIERPAENGSTYLFEHDAKLFATARGGGGVPVFEWDDKDSQWLASPGTPRFPVRIADDLFVSETNTLRWKDEPVLETEDPESLTEHYFANGHLLVRVRQVTDEDTWKNHLIAIPWRPGQPDKLNQDSGTILPLRSSKEFVYAFGQLNDQVVAATNTGGLYVFKDNKWVVLVEPDRGTSFQIYTIINHFDSLLMGHYPTGELYEYNGENLKLKSDWPPVMPGVHKQAREAQTCAIYGGELYTGVWPWGEVWRFDQDSGVWHFVDRMFSHPALTDKFRHPYEENLFDSDGVKNVWGQRVTSLIPHGDSLFVGTSAKTTTSAGPTFLSQADYGEYGSVVRLSLPGNIAVPTEWTEPGSPTTFAFEISDESIVIKQDGETLGSTSLTKSDISRLQSADIEWGTGIYGKIQGEISSKSCFGED